jgi:glycosyltransferase involved in cell wall biosynthesis
VTPTLSIVSPTQGRATLERTIASGRDQLLPGDEWIVVIDDHEMASQVVIDNIERRIERACGPACVVMTHDAGRHDWGHSQSNYGISVAQGDWLVFQDDDDTFTPGALAAIRRTIGQLPSARPLLFRFRARWGQLIWAQIGDLRQGRIGGHCLVIPRLPGLIGRFGTRYEGDHDMILSTLALWDARGVAPEWCGQIITVQGQA